MPDREKVIKGLERCHSYDIIMCDEGCPYYRTVGCFESLRKDALALLKEQEAVEPIHNYGTFRCGNCKNIVGYNDGKWYGYQSNFCSKCGKAVKWE